MSRHCVLALAAQAALAVLPAPQAAAEAGPGASAPAGAWSSSVFVANAKLLRGLRQGNADAVFGADLAWRGDTGWALAGGLSGPAWHGFYTSTEWTLAASRTWHLQGEHNLQAGVGRYGYQGSAIARERGYTELNLAWGWRERWSASLALLPEARGYGPRWRSSRGLALATELNWRQRLVGATTLEIGLGHVDLERVQGRSYTWGQLLLAGDLGPLRWHAGWVASDAVTQGVAGPQLGGSHWLATLSWTR